MLGCSRYRHGDFADGEIANRMSDPKPHVTEAFARSSVNRLKLAARHRLVGFVRKADDGASVLRDVANDAEKGHERTLVRLRDVCEATRIDGSSHDAKTLAIHRPPAETERSRRRRSARHQNRRADR